MTFELRLEKVFLIDIELVIKPINIVRLNRLPQIFQRLQIRYLSESQHVVVKELYSTSRPSHKLIHHDPYGLGIHTSEVYCNDAVLFQVLRTVAVQILGYNKSVLNTNPLRTILCILKIKRLDLTLFNELQLKSVESYWLLTLFEFIPNIVSLFVCQSLPSLRSRLHVIIVLIFKCK